MMSAKDPIYGDLKAAFVTWTYSYFSIVFCLACVSDEVFPTIIMYAIYGVLCYKRTHLFSANDDNICA